MSGANLFLIDLEQEDEGTYKCQVNVTVNGKTVLKVPNIMHVQINGELYFVTI